MTKEIIITGAAGFLGSKFSKFFADTDYKVIGIDKNEKKLKLIESENIVTICADITNEKEVSQIHNFLKKKYNICGLINNAAIDAVPSKTSLKNLRYPSLDTWNIEINVSIIGTFLMTKYFGELMIKKKNGSIINIGSDLSFIVPNQKIYKSSYKNYIKPVTYSVIKHGMLGLTKYFASLYGKSNVRVNMISPGPIKNNQSKKLLNELKNIIPMERLADPKEILGLLYFLTSSESSYITGQNILIDGGRTII